MKKCSNSPGQWKEKKAKLLTFLLKERVAIPSLHHPRFAIDPFLVVFVMILIYSLWIIHIGWNNPILDLHGFRQTQTAISVFYLLQGGNWLAYETPVLGFPWSISFEFPVYQWIVALLVQSFHIPLDQTGRFVSVSFFYLCLIPSYIILGYFNISRQHRWIFLSLFLASPLYLFWSRTFLIESTALFLGLTYLAASIAYFHPIEVGQRKLGLLALAALFGVLAALVKITTFAGFLFAAALVVLWHWQNSSKRKADWIQIVLFPAIGFAVLPYLAVATWTHFADAQKLLNPLAEIYTSKALTEWNFGTLEQRTHLRLLGSFLDRCFTDLWGRRMVIFLLLLTAWMSKRKTLCFAAIAIFVVATLTFVNLHLVHNYYQYATGIFVIAAMGFCIVGLLEKQKIWRRLGYAIFALLLFSQIRGYYLNWSIYASVPNRQILPTAVAAQTYTRPDEVLLIYGLGWSSELPYYSERRSAMIVQENESKVPIVLQNLEQAGYRVGAMLLCDWKRSNLETVAQLTDTYHFQPNAVYSDRFCDIHLPE